MGGAEGRPVGGGQPVDMSLSLRVGECGSPGPAAAWWDTGPCTVPGIALSGWG